MRLAPGDGAVSRALAAADRFVSRAGLTADAANAVRMVVEEWTANIVEHGRPKATSRIVVAFARDGASVRLAFTDAGRPFDPRTFVFSGPNPQRGGGAGIAMITSLGRIAGYRRTGGRNRLTIELPV